VNPRLVNRLSVALVILGAALWAAAPTILDLPDSFTLWLGVSSAVLLQLWRLGREHRRRRRNLISTATAVHRFAARFDPVRALGLHRSAVAVRAASPTLAPDRLPPYVPGRIDDVISDGLSRRSFALVVGNSLCGKSRAAFEAVRSLHPNAEIWVPAGPEGLRSLLRCDPPLPGGWRTVVVWLDDIDYFLGEPQMDGGESAADPYPDFTAALFQRHLADRRWWSAWRPRLLFVATINRRRFEQIADPGDSGALAALNRRLRGVLALAERAELSDGEQAGWDTQIAAQLYPGVDFTEGIGRAFAEGEALIRAYRHGSDPIGRAFVRAAVDWQRIGAAAPAADQLRSLLPAELPGQIVDDRQLATGLRWANRKLAGGQRLLTERQSADIPPRYEAHPYVIDADEGYIAEAEPRPVPDAVWGIALSSFDAIELLGIAELALERDGRAAERILGHLADDISVARSDAMLRSVAQWMLGDLYAGQAAGAEAAEKSLSAAIAGPNPDVRVEALLSRGRLFDRLGGRRAEADADFAAAQRVAGADAEVHAGARHESGRRHQIRKEHDEAIVDFTAVIEAGAAAPALRGICLIKRAYALRDLGRDDRAIADFTAAIRLDASPRSVAIAYMERAQFAPSPNEELAELTAAIGVEGAPSSYRGYAYCLRADRLAELGKPEAAAADYDAACELDDVDLDDHATFQRERASFYEDRDPARATREYTEVISTPGLPPAEVARARVSLGIMRSTQLTAKRDVHLVEMVAADLNWAIDHGDPRTRSKAQYWLARLWDHGYGTESSALAFFDAATETDGADEDVVASAYIHRGLLHSAHGRHEEAIADYTRGIEIPGARGHSHAVGHANRGLMWLCDLDDPAAAEADFRAALWTQGGAEVSAGCLGHLVDLLRSQGRYAEELPLYRAAIASGRVELVAAALPRVEALGRRRAWRSARRARRTLRRARVA